MNFSVLTSSVILILSEEDVHLIFPFFKTVYVHVVYKSKLCLRLSLWVWSKSNTQCTSYILVIWKCLEQQDNKNYMFWGFIKTICNIHKLFNFPCLYSTPPLSPSECASVLLQCISEKIVLSAPLGGDLQRATYFASTTNMQLSPKVASTLHQPLEMVEDGCTDSNTPTSTLLFFYGRTPKHNKTNMLINLKSMWLDISGDSGKFVFKHFIYQWWRSGFCMLW